MEAIELPDNYRPSEDEEYMNELQLEYFRRKLLGWREQLERESGDTLTKMREDHDNEPDPVDRGSLEADQALELRARDRHRKLIRKIDDALERIEDGSYGFCEDTGEEIGLARLEARPVATLSVEAQERKERAERRQKAARTS